MHGRHFYRGDPMQAVRLEAARRSAGFETSKEACEAFGWSATYAAHEQAKRRIGDEAISEYAKAFDVSETWLRGGEPDPTRRDAGIRINPRRLRLVERRIEDSVRGPTNENLWSGARIRVARTIAGFESQAAAANAIGIHRTTHGEYEWGHRPLSLKVAQVYAQLFGCDADWLMDGGPRSGFPAGLDQHIAGLVEVAYRELRTAAEMKWGPVGESVPMPKFAPREADESEEPTVPFYHM